MLLHNCVCELTACVSTPCTSASVLDTSMCVQLSSCSTEFWSKWHNWLLLGLQQLWDTIQQKWWVLVSSGLCTNTNCIFICSINVTFMKLHNKDYISPNPQQTICCPFGFVKCTFCFLHVYKPHVVPLDDMSIVMLLIHWWTIEDSTYDVTGPHSNLFVTSGWSWSNHALSASWMSLALCNLTLQGVVGCHCVAYSCLFLEWKCK